MSSGRMNTQVAATTAALPDVLLSVASVVSRTGLSERTIRGEIASGRLKAIRPGGLRSVRVPASALAEWLQSAKPAEASPRYVRASRKGSP
jgi:excisionase family DNA binding protein